MPRLVQAHPFFYQKTNRRRHSIRMKFPYQDCNVVDKQPRQLCFRIIKLEQLLRLTINYIIQQMLCLCSKTGNVEYSWRSNIFRHILRSTAPSIHHGPHLVDSLLHAGSLPHRSGTTRYIESNFELFTLTSIETSYATEPFIVFRNAIQHVKCECEKSVDAMLIEQNNHTIFEW